MNDDLIAHYPTLARLADPAQTTVGYQKPDLVREGVAAFRELERAADALRELQRDYDARTGYINERVEGWRVHIQSVAAERDALAAAMPSDGADAALAYAAMKTERDTLAARLKEAEGLLREAALGWEPGAEICQCINAFLAADAKPAPREPQER